MFDKFEASGGGMPRGTLLYTGALLRSLPGSRYPLCLMKLDIWFGVFSTLKNAEKLDHRNIIILTSGIALRGEMAHPFYPCGLLLLGRVILLERFQGEKSRCFEQVMHPLEDPFY